MRSNLESKFILDTCSFRENKRGTFKYLLLSDTFNHQVCIHTYSIVLFLIFEELTVVFVVFVKSNINSTKYANDVFHFQTCEILGIT